MHFREETDALGTVQVPADALHGVHTARAMENFALAGRPVHPALVRAFGAVKIACAQANHELQPWDAPVYDAICAACREMMAGRLDAHVKADALQGGAGTSLNMSVNEVLANRALQLLGRAPGTYAAVDPLGDINRHQSTNDVFPTALRVAALRLLEELERSAVRLQEAFQRKEKEFAGIVKVGRTELQDAVLTTMGRSMSAFAEAFARDRWRVYKCRERLRTVNLGGTAIGTGLGAPRRYIFRAVEALRAVTGLNLARAENMVEATQNCDVFVEVSGILKAAAANLLKTCGDLRLMASGPDAGLGELLLPERQAGSSIMPGKVNPVIPEAVSQAAMMAIAMDCAVTQAAAAGNLELNAFMPLIADALLWSIDLLARACDALERLCVRDLRVNEAACRRHVGGATAALTALVERIGYRKAEDAAARARAEGRAVRDVVVSEGLLSEEEFDRLTSPEAVLRLGSGRGEGGGWKVEGGG